MVCCAWAVANVEMLTAADMMTDVAYLLMGPTPIREDYKHRLVWLQRAHSIAGRARAIAAVN